MKFTNLLILLKNTFNRHQKFLHTQKTHTRKKIIPYPVFHEPKTSLKINKIKNLILLHMHRSDSSIFNQSRYKPISFLFRKNISFQSKINQEKFKNITGHDRLPEILKGIEILQDIGFKNIKINAVL